jgi:hypothetical protein
MSILVVVFVMMHSVCCIWLLIGENFANSWILNPVYGVNAIYGNVWNESTQSWVANGTTKYITSFYWTVTTLATVGYGDVKGFTW